MKEIFNQKSKCIRVYIGKETEVDPYEHNVEVTLMSPINIKAIVTDLTTTQAEWKIPGIKTSRVKDLLIEKRHRNLLEMSQQIEVRDGNTLIVLEGWRVNGKMQIRNEGDYFRVYAYSKIV